MTILYYLLTVILTSVATLYIPTLVVKYRQYKHAKKQKLNELIRAEVERQLKQIIND